MRTMFSTIITLLMLSWSGLVLGSDQVTLTVGGTGSGLGFMRLLGESYSALHPDVTVKVLPSLGTAGGIRAVKNGAIDLAIASRLLSEQENFGIKNYYLGESPLVFAVHPATEINDITLAQVIHIFKGTIQAWGDGTKIRRILRPYNDSDWLLMQDLSPELSKALEQAQGTKGLYLAVTDTDTVSYLERIRGSFGASTLAMILAEKRNVKILSFNGIQPAIMNNGKVKYPLLKSFSLLTSSEPSDAVDSFVDFILSDLGLLTLAEFGILPNDEQS